MFGTNKQRKKDYGHDGMTLEVKEIFSTIQGEGPFFGVPAVFVRLAGCHLKCYFCDTSFEDGKVRDLERQVIADIISESLRAKAVKTDLVVLTGGEPMRQNILPLCKILIEYGFHIQIETAGTYWVDGLELLIEAGLVSIVCSPKTGAVHESIADYCFNWKYLIQEGGYDPLNGLPNKSTQVPGMKQELFRPDTLTHEHTIWVQPCEAYKVSKIETYEIGMKESEQVVTDFVRDEEQTKRNMKLAAEIAIRHNYRLSIQMHKILGLP